MRIGEFRDGHPRAVLSLPGRFGPMEIEFVVDTGFEGDFILSPDIVRSLGAAYSGSAVRLLADGSANRWPRYEFRISGRLRNANS